jgi:hypothetical protein
LDGLIHDAFTERSQPKESSLLQHAELIYRQVEETVLERANIGITSRMDAHQNARRYVLSSHSIYTLAIHPFF